MSKWVAGFPTDITDKYYALWGNSSKETTGDSYSLKQIFCLPDMTDKKGLLIDVDKTLLNIAHGNILIAAIKGPAGSGKTSLISYLCNNPNIIDKNTGIMVWTLPKSMDLLRIVMGECNRYANDHKKSRMMLVFENTYGFEINIEEIVDTIAQRQSTWYPYISVIITCRNNEDRSTHNNCETLYIRPFSKEKILLFEKKYASLNTEANNSHVKIEPLINIYGTETIGNPAILSLLLKSARSYSNIEINKAEDIYALLINQGMSENTSHLLETIACLMFINQTEYIPIKTLHDYLNAFDFKEKDIINDLGMSCVFKDNTISFVHRSLYEYSLAGCLAALIHKISNSDMNDRPIRQLFKLFSSGKLSNSMVGYFESKIKNNDSVQHSVFIKQIEQLFKQFLTGELSSYYEKNQHLPFMSLLHKEMNIFFNLCTVYHSVLRINGSTKLLVHSRPVEECFMNYLMLFSEFGGDAEIDLSEIDFSGQDFSNMTLKHINLSFCNFRKCSFNYSKLEKVVLKGANLYESDLHCIQLQEVDLSSANLANVRLSESKILDSTLSSSNFCSADMYRCSMKTVNCKNANFHGANLDFALFTDGDFKGANFSNSYLRNAVFNESNFENTNLSGVSI